MQFFGIIKHDLRSPVVGLIHFLHLKKESPEILDEDTKERLENQTFKSAENLLVQMEDLLLWSKGQMNHFQPEKKSITVETIFKDIEDNFSWEDRIKFSFEFQENLSVFTDKEYLKTITRNLTNNAIKILEKAGCEVVYNEKQTCCGQPAYNAGYWEQAKEVGTKFLSG